MNRLGLVADAGREVYRRDWLRAHGVPDGSRLTWMWSPDQAAMHVRLSHPWAGVFSVGVFGDAPPPASLERYMDEVHEFLLGLVGWHLLHLAAWYPLWWEGEAVLDL